jgi:hypothetical protein
VTVGTIEHVDARLASAVNLLTGMATFRRFPARLALAAHEARLALAYITEAGLRLTQLMDTDKPKVAVAAVAAIASPTLVALWLTLTGDAGVEPFTVIVLLTFAAVGAQGHTEALLTAQAAGAITILALITLAALLADLAALTCDAAEGAGALSISGAGSACRERIPTGAIHTADKFPSAVIVALAARAAGSLGFTGVVVADQTPGAVSVKAAEVALADIFGTNHEYTQGVAVLPEVGLSIGRRVVDLIA